MFSKLSSLNNDFFVKNMILDALKFKVSIKSLRTAYKIYNIKKDIFNFKLKVKDMKRINAKDIRVAIKIYNIYTRGEKIDVEKFLQLIMKYVTFVGYGTNMNKLKGKTEEIEKFKVLFNEFKNKRLNKR